MSFLDIPENKEDIQIEKIIVITYDDIIQATNEILQAMCEKLIK